MADEEQVFNFDAFYQALDVTRQSRNLTWKQVGEAASVSASTLARMGQGRRPDAAGLATLSAWSGLNPGDFVRDDGKLAPETVAEVSRLLASDPTLEPGRAAALVEIFRTAYVQMQQTESTDKTS